MSFYVLRSTFCVIRYTFGGQRMPLIPNVARRTWNDISDGSIRFRLLVWNTAILRAGLALFDVVLRSEGRGCR